MMVVSCSAVLIVVLPFPILILSATGLECNIYVSSSDGINNTSCWTGGYQTPCATLDLALQGTATDAIQDNCSSGIVISLSPGTYTLDTGFEQRIYDGMANVHKVSLSSLCVNDSSLPTPLHNSLVTGNNCQLALNITFINLPLHCYSYYYYEQETCKCKYLQFTASIIDSCSGKTFDWYNDLQICLMEPSKLLSCYNISLLANDCCGHFCFNYFFQLPTCFDSISSFSPIEVTFLIETLGLINLSTFLSTNLTLQYFTAPLCDTQIYCPPYISFDSEGCSVTYCSLHNLYFNSTFCVDSHTGYCCQICTYGVPINMLNTCAQCTDYLLSILIFIGIEILPMTIMVLLIIVLNIQLTNGSINGLVLYSQMNLIMFPEFILRDNYFAYDDYDSYCLWLLALIPRIIFNLDFTPLLYNSISLCITPNMSPLGAVSFWYVIGFYPLFLLLLIYVWIVLYDKGFKCVVCITRPFHCCMARFWSMTGIEPSLTHSIASIYVLCFTQLAVVSFKILSFTHIDSNSTVFFFDAKQEFFKGFHALAGSFAILVLLFLILLPTLYIQFYPLKWFQKLLDYLKLRKQLLMSLGDVFTGPYKNGSDNTFDYRYTCGLFLLARLFIMFQFTFASYYILFSILFAKVFCFSVLALILLIFRPFQRNIHNFCEVFLLFVMIFYFILLYQCIEISYVLCLFNGLVFVIILPGYIIYHLYKMITNCYHYHKQHNRTVPDYEEQDEENQSLVDDDWIADRVENPQYYDEQHVPVRLDDFSQEYHQLNINTAAATYGTINNDQ